jgi:hypothetical protein
METFINKSIYLWFFNLLYLLMGCVGWLIKEEKNEKP